MCDLLGVSSLYPVTLEMSFQKLMQRADTINPDGWGIVFHEDADAYQFREPCPGSNSPLAHMLGNCGIQSSLVISHIRKATTGKVKLANTHPFTRELHGRVHSFAFNGDVPDVFDWSLPSDRFQPIGETDGEYAFCYLLDELAALPEGDWQPKAALIKTFGDRLATMGPANFLYSDGCCLYAYASRRRTDEGEYPPGLYYLTRQCEQQADVPQHRIGLTIQSTTCLSQSLVLVSSVPLSDEPWIPFEENQMLVIRNGNIRAY